MKYAAAIIAAAAGVSAWGSNVTYVTKTVDSYVTYCPGPTQITHGSKTYTITEATTFTITDCPCTITAPVHTTPVVVCETCAPPPPPVYHNTTVPAANPPGAASPTGSAPAAPNTPIPTAGAGKAAALSGAGLAAIVGMAAFL